MKAEDTTCADLPSRSIPLKENVNPHESTITEPEISDNTFELNVIGSGIYQPKDYVTNHVELSDADDEPYMSSFYMKIEQSKDAKITEY